MTQTDDKLNRYDPEYDYTIDGFDSLETASEFARRWVRDSVEELRKPGQSKGELRAAWFTFGEDAVVVGGDYAGAKELDFFIEHSATAQERYWQALRPSRRHLG
jgi:hypothetical protein